MTQGHTFVISLSWILILTLRLEVAAFSTPSEANKLYLSTGRRSLTLEGTTRLLLNPFSPPKDEVTINQESVLESLALESSLEPRRFFVESNQLLDIIGASFPTLFRLFSGVFVDGYKVSFVEKDESKYTVASFGDYQIEESCSLLISKRFVRSPLIIYEFEGCPFCRKVREAVSILALDITFRPCPQNGYLFRSDIKSKYGEKSTFPFMIDPNTGIELFESDEIIQYLFRAYGNDEVPSSLTGGASTIITAGLGLLPRFGKGSKKMPSNLPEKPLVLWSYEGSPFCKVVREKLCELEIQHTQISCPRGSPIRQTLFEKTGTFQAPYLEDPNNGVSLFESAAICEYLDKMYSVKPSPIDFM